MTAYAQVALAVPLKRYFTYSFDPEAQKVPKGVRVRVPFARREATGFVVDVLKEPPESGFEIKSIIRAIDKEPLFGDDQISLALWMERFYLCARGEALSAMIPGGRRDSGTPVFQFDEFVASVTPTAEQEAAIEEILSGRHRSCYLYGITGSGKTEVFLRVAEKVIERGRQVIYLVPEITLTHQLAQTIAGRFGNRVAILHSAMTPSMRIKEWRRIMRGEVSLVIGARSAVFAPCPDLGLVVIDEEHENSYKSDNTPRYHARQIAQVRAERSGALLLMGSATPSLESYKMAEDPDRLFMIRLTKRVSGGALPKTQVVSVLGQKSLISPTLAKEMDRTISSGRQVVLFLNRRGYNHSFHCNTCGYELTCPHCAVTLTYHKAEDALVCHYCGYRTRRLDVCPQCGSLDVSYRGFGTEMVETEVRRLFPDARVARLDTDVARDRKAAGAVIDDFRDGKYDILLGTQMVAKGLNFPNLALVGIVYADSTLSIPDFRSSERTFGLIVQVSGRSGRYDSEGKVIIQTANPRNPAIEFAVSGKADEFYAMELEIRRQTGFPPFSRMVRLVFRGKDLDKVSAAASSVGGLLQKALDSRKRPGEFLEILGPNECPVAKIAQNFRHQILIRGENPSRVHNLASKVLGGLKPFHGVYTEVDFDPLNLM